MIGNKKMAAIVSVATEHLDLSLQPLEMLLKVVWILFCAGGNHTVVFLYSKMQRQGENALGEL